MSKSIDTDTLKKIQIDILLYVQDYCMKNNIQFWIDCGSLLGAVRHKGYIPWDDDIDIGMLRKDYEKFIQEFNKDNNSSYRVYSPELTQNYPFPFGKIYDERTVLYEPNEKGHKLSVYIDLFVYDNAPDEEKELEKKFRKRNILNRFRWFQFYKGRPTHRKNFLIKAGMFVTNLPFRLFPVGYFDKKIVENARTYENVQTKRVGNFLGQQRMVCDKSVFDSFTWLEFEGIKVRAMSGYDQYLTCFYGDYMKLPPVEKQKPHHNFVAYYKQ